MVFILAEKLIVNVIIVNVVVKILVVVVLAAATTGSSNGISSYNHSVSCAFNKPVTITSLKITPTFSQ